MPHLVDHTMENAPIKPQPIVPPPPQPIVPPPPQPISPQPQAIVFLPGLGEGGIGPGGIDQTPDGIAKRLVDALNRSTVKNQFELLSDGKEEEYATDCKTTIRTIGRVGGSKPTPLYHLYQFHYNKSLTRRFDNYGLLWKLVVLSYTLVGGLPRVLKAFVAKRAGSKTVAERFQLVYTSAILGLLCVYLIILAWALVDLTCQVFQIELPRLPSSGSEWFDGFTQDVSRVMSKVAGWLAILLTVVGLTWSSLTTMLSQLATAYLCATNYLAKNERRAVLTGQFDKLLKHVATQVDGEIHVISYSFGTVVGIDALFPVSDPAPKITGRVKSFVSIGCPYDLIRTYWPKYFERPRHGSTTQKWLNVYSPRDLLGSNFRAGPDAGKAEVGLSLEGAKDQLVPENIEYKNDTEGSRGLFAALFFEGLHVHSSYWGDTYESERTCFSLIVTALGLGPKA